jgi:flagellar assembly protein FliH
VNADSFVIRGAAEGAPLELRGTPRAPAVLPVQRSGPGKPAPAATDRVFPDADASLERARQDAHAAAYGAGRAQGEKDGYEAGLKRALERAELERRTAAESNQAGQQKLADALEKLQRMAEAAARQKAVFLEGAEDDMVALAFEAFCRVLGETAATPDMMRAGVANALAHWRGKAALEIHLHPEDLKWLETDENLSTRFAAHAHPAIRWVASAEVAVGGCMLRSAEGALDARLDVQLEAFKTMLIQTRASRRAEGSA